MKNQVIDEAITTNGQAYDYTALERTPAGDRIKIKVHADTSYRQQAYASVSLFNSVGEWTHIASLPTERWHADMPSSYGKHDEPKLAACRQVATALRRRAAAFLG